MKNISKTRANEIAIKLNEKRKNEIEKLYLELEALCTDLAIEYLHDKYQLKISDFSEKLKPFFNYVHRIYIIGCGFSTEEFETKKIPSTTKYIFHIALEKPTEKSEKIRQLSNELKTLKKEYKDLVLKTETAIYSLKTYKNIQNHFSIASPYLTDMDETKNTSLQINFSSLINEIKIKS